MGQALSNPVSSQFLQRTGTKHMRIGSSEMRKFNDFAHQAFRALSRRQPHCSGGLCAVSEGFRITMEDTHTIKTSLAPHNDIAFFGIYDGHAGDKCSIFLEQKLWQAVAALKDPTDAKQLREAYLKVDAEFLKREDERSHGSAAVVAMVRSPKGEE